MPARAYAGALAELVAMEPLVLAGSRPKWRALATDIERRLATNASDPTIPHALQAMWREIDFGRNYWRVRVAKNTTITTITWSLLLAATLATIIVLPRVGPADPAETNVWMIALLGLLGGSISALRSTDMISMGERRPIEIEASRVRLRPVVGAASAIVVYVLGRSNLVFELVNGEPLSSAPIQIKVPNIALAYYAFAFLAGFAERWFLKILELAETRTDPSPVAKPNATGMNCGHPPAPPPPPPSPPPPPAPPPQP